MLRNVSVCTNPDCRALWQPGFRVCPTCDGALRLFGTDPADRDHPRAHMFPAGYLDTIARTAPAPADGEAGAVVSSFDPDDEVAGDLVGAGGPGRPSPSRRRPRPPTGGA